jgi:hypothetical protein
VTRHQALRWFKPWPVAAVTDLAEQERQRAAFKAVLEQARIDHREIVDKLDTPDSDRD